MARVYEVWCGRPGFKPGMLISYDNPETANRVREHQLEILNRDADPANPWRVWVENKRDNDYVRRAERRISKDRP